jgi:hypothetical protein
MKRWVQAALISLATFIEWTTRVRKTTDPLSLVSETPDLLSLSNKTWPRSRSLILLWIPSQVLVP